MELHVSMIEVFLLCALLAAAITGFTKGFEFLILWVAEKVIEAKNPVRRKKNRRKAFI